MVPVVTGTAGQVTVFSPYCQFQRARAGGGGLPKWGWVANQRPRLARGNSFFWHFPWGRLESGLPVNRGPPLWFGFPFSLFVE